MVTMNKMASRLGLLAVAVLLAIGIGTSGGNGKLEEVQAADQTVTLLPADFGASYAAITVSKSVNSTVFSTYFSQAYTTASKIQCKNPSTINNTTSGGGIIKNIAFNSVKGSTTNTVSIYGKATAGLIKVSNENSPALASQQADSLAVLVLALPTCTVTDAQVNDMIKEYDYMSADGKTAFNAKSTLEKTGAKDRYDYIRSRHPGVNGLNAFTEISSKLFNSDHSVVMVVVIAIVGLTAVYAYSKATRRDEN